MVWAQELQAALKKITSMTDMLAAKMTEESEITQQGLMVISQQLHSALQTLWTRDDGLFEIKYVGESDGAYSFKRSQPKRSSCPSFGGVLPRTVLAVRLRAHPPRACRHHGYTCCRFALQSHPSTQQYRHCRSGGPWIGMCRPRIWANCQPLVHQAFKNRLSDSSPAVRDASVELVGKYVVKTPALAAEYYPHIALRVSVSPKKWLD